MKQLADKVAFITGGSRGIGAGIAIRLAAAGANVVITYANSTEKAALVVEQVRSHGSEGLAIRADHTRQGAVSDALAQAKAHFGKIDIIVNNAGIYVGKPMEEHTMEDYEETMAVNVRGVFEAAIFAARELPDGGRFITIGSNLAERVPAPGATLYSMSKSAIMGLTRGLARDLGPRRITVNAVQPGPTNTDMNPDNTPLADQLRSMMAIPQYAGTQDMAALVAFLAGEEGRFITGSMITADGGMNA